MGQTMCKRDLAPSCQHRSDGLVWTSSSVGVVVLSAAVTGLSLEKKMQGWPGLGKWTKCVASYKKTSQPSKQKQPKLGTFQYELMCRGKKAGRFLWNFEGEDCWRREAVTRTHIHSSAGREWKEPLEFCTILKEYILTWNNILILNRYCCVT